MSIQMKLAGLNPLKAQLTTLGKKYKATNSVAVGYGAFYAVYVHENLEVNHPIHSKPGRKRGLDCTGQAKFLEQPLRQNRSFYIKEFKEMVKDYSVNRAIEHVAVTLLEDSRELVPVDTGNLHRSGYVRIRKM
jgi:hypothetical protein